MIRATARSMSAFAVTSAGDLPPSSSVTGVRFRAAASMTFLPTSPLPVNSRWSNGSSENAAPMSGPPRITESSSGAKRRAAASAIQSLKLGTYSDVFSSARLPATNAATKGPIDRNSG